MGDDYPDLDELVRQFLAGATVASVERVLMPRVWEQLRPAFEAGIPISGVRVRGVAYIVAQELVLNWLKEHDDPDVPDVAALAGAPGALPPGLRAAGGAA